MINGDLGAGSNATDITSHITKFLEVVKPSTMSHEARALMQKGSSWGPLCAHHRLFRLNLAMLENRKTYIRKAEFDLETSRPHGSNQGRQHWRKKK